MMDRALFSKAVRRSRVVGWIFLFLSKFHFSVLLAFSSGLRHSQLVILCLPLPPLFLILIFFCSLRNIYPFFATMVYPACVGHSNESPLKTEATECEVT